VYRNIYYSPKDSVCHLFTWDENGNRIVEKHPHQPFFYIETNSDTVDATSIFNTKLKKKVFRNNYERNRSAQDGAIKRLYHNIQVEQQFLIEKYHDLYDKPEFTKLPLRIQFLDIEVFSPDEFPEAKDAKHPINLITIHDSLTEKFYTWGCKPYTPKKTNVVYTLCTSETDILNKVIEFYEQGNTPDILSGWNTDFFDFPYVINRIRKLLGDENAKRLSPVKSMWCREGIFVKGQELDKWYIHGVALMDYLEVYKGFSRVLLESYALNFVAEHELGEGKLAINATNLATLADKDWINFVEYNIQDTDLLVRMENKLQLFRIIRMLAYKGLTSFEAALGKVSIVTGCVALEARKHGMVIPTFVEGPTRNPIEGGFVRDPERGLQKSVVSYDANSLYPNTIITLNISPETKVGKIISKDEDSVTILLTSNKEYKVSKEKFVQFVQNEKLAISRANVLYTQKTKGVVPSLIDSLYSERVYNRKQYVDYKKQLAKLDLETDEYKNIKAKMDRADTIQHVIKILLNSIYGVFANKFSPICDSDHAGSITLTGQAVVKQASEIFDQYAREKFNITNKSLTIYNDTDSTYISVQPLLDARKLSLIENGKIAPETIKFIDEELGVHLNNEIKKWAAHKLNSIDPRYFFKREAISDVGVFLEKKRYIMHVLNDEGADVNKFKYVGVEIARSTTPKKAKELIKKVIESSILVQDQSKANSIYREVYDSFKGLPMDDIAIRGGLSDIEKYEVKADGFKIAKGTPNHVKGAIWYNQLLKHRNLGSKYEKIGSGGKVKKIYIAPNKYNIDTLCYTGGFPAELKDFEVDYEEMFATIIEPPVKAVYNALNWQLPQVNNEAQTDLFDLFT
jgi:DNA polymerase elongation subunit (family B)